MNFTQKVLEAIQAITTEYFTAKQLCGTLQTHSTLERQFVAEALQQLCNDCKLVFDAKNRRYRKVKEGEFGTAVFDANSRGFGFLLTDDGDLFVPASKTNGAFHRDTVLFKRTPGTKDEAEVVKILSRGMTQVVGTYDKSNHARFVIPDNGKFVSDIFILPRHDLNALDGQKVVVNITHFPDDNRNSPEGEIVQVLGFPNQKNVDMLSVACAYGLSQDFPDDCLAQAAKLPQTVSDDEIASRRDLRSQTIFTIDGEDAKDLDDAVSIAANPDGTFTLGVHIADVSHYVKPSDDIDKEAFRRGTSVYFPQTVFPMLPTSLSNGICSLYQGVTRLTLTCEMIVTSDGKVTQCDVYPSVICSKHRLTYTAVQAIFDGDAETSARYSDIVSDLFTMKTLAQALQAQRNRRGNIDFSTKEVHFVHDDNGEVVDILPVQHTFAHQLIEEFMIAANESVAQYATACGYPFVYRTHQPPEQDKYNVLLALMRGVGIKVNPSQQIHNSTLQAALLAAKQTPYFQLINDVMLRTMQKARYSAQNTGHFGLASSCYCHFTSPIRRYADLFVHRVLKTAISGKMTEKAFAYYEDEAPNAAKQASSREKLADEAERKADDVKRCAYAKRLVGQSFSAIVSGVTERGIYCELPNTVEGFVSVEKLGASLTYNPQQFCLYNDAVRYALGDSITITVASVNLKAAKIDFDIPSATRPQHQK